MNDFEKVAKVETALRTVAAETRKAGGPNNVRASGAIDEFLQRAEMDTKLRLANLILENPETTREEAIVQLRQTKRQTL